MLRNWNQNWQGNSVKFKIPLIIVLAIRLLLEFMINTKYMAQIIFLILTLYA